MITKFDLWKTAKSAPWWATQRFRVALRQALDWLEKSEQDLYREQQAHFETMSKLESAKNELEQERDELRQSWEAARNEVFRLEKKNQEQFYVIANLEEQAERLKREATVSKDEISSALVCCREDLDNAFDHIATLSRTISPSQG